MFNVDCDEHILNFETKNHIPGWEEQHSFSSKKLYNLFYCVCVPLPQNSKDWVGTPISRNPLAVQMLPLTLYCSLHLSKAVCLHPH